MAKARQPAHAERSKGKAAPASVTKNVIVKEGYLPVNEILFDRPGAPSPFGEDVEFPLPTQTIGYIHPVDGVAPTH